MISTKINTNDPSNPLDKQFIFVVFHVYFHFYVCAFVFDCRRPSFSLGPNKLCLFCPSFVSSCSVIVDVFNSMRFFDFLFFFF